MAKIILPAGEKGTFATIDGIFKCQVTGPKLAYARGSGAPTIEAYLNVIAGPKTGERVYQQWSLQDDSLWRLRDDLRATGRLPRDKYPTDNPIELDDSVAVQFLDGMTGDAAIFLDNWKGQPRSKLEGFLTPEEVAKRLEALKAAPAKANSAKQPAATGTSSSLPPASEPF